MIAVLVLIFALVSMAAAAFVVLPLLRTRKDSRKPWLAVGGGFAVMLVGLGSYAFLGQPDIALNSLTGPSTTNYPALVALLARQMPQRPGDIEGWALLGRGYLALGQPAQAAKAFLHVGRVPAPVLLVQGTADVIVSPDDAGRLADRAREDGHDDVTVRMLDGVGHDFGDHDATFGALRDWLLRVA